MGVIVVHRPRAAASILAHWSASALDDPLEGDARLVVGVPSGLTDAIVLGAFQRRSELPPPFAQAPGVYRRGSGGGAVSVGPGSVWVQLALARPDALVASDLPRLLNRYVRPLLRALGASYFGRDWVSVAHRPVATVGVAHDTGTGRVLFEAIVAATTPFALAERASFRGKVPATLEAISGKAIDPESIAEAVVRAYVSLGEVVPGAPLTEITAVPVGDEPPWSATIAEAIGPISAGPDEVGRVRLGGELMASRDAIARLEEAILRGDDLAAAVDRALADPSVFTFGVRSLASIRDVLVAATSR